MDSDGVFLLSSLFNGFPPFSGNILPIKIYAGGEVYERLMVIEAGWVSEDRDKDGAWRLVPKQKELFEEEADVPALVLAINGERRILPLDYVRKYAYRGRPMRPDLADDTSLPCVFVSPYGGERTAALGVLWDKIALTERERYVVEALRIIDPNITAVAMVGEGGGANNAQLLCSRASFPVQCRCDPSEMG